jgi:hypothetical protein
MYRTFDHSICIDTLEGVMDDCPATYLIDTDTDAATLRDFRIGKREFTRADALLMVGEDETYRQEAIAYEAWLWTDCVDMAFNLEAAE